MAKFSSRQAAEHPADLEATQARQGAWGWDVLLVLLASTSLAILALFVALILTPDLGGEGPGVRQSAPQAAGVETPEGQPTGF